MTVVLAIIITALVVGAFMAEANHQSVQRLHKAYWRQLDYIALCVLFARVRGDSCDELDVVKKMLTDAPHDLVPQLDPRTRIKTVLHTPIGTNPPPPYPRPPAPPAPPVPERKGYQGLD